MTTGRRQFLTRLGTAGAGAASLALRAQAGAAAANPARSRGGDRAFWVDLLVRVATPVLSHLADGTLVDRMPVECPRGSVGERRKVTHLEAVGRTLAGIAPWLELEEKAAEEAGHARRLGDWARSGLARATDPGAAGALSFRAGPQNLVDAAFLAHGLLRAPHQLWERLDPAVQARVVEAMLETRRFKPGRNNWLLFAAMVETFLARAGAAWREEPIEDAIRSHELWYRGDGTYGDGQELHWDYYNSYVIQPMLVDGVEAIGKVTSRWAGELPGLLARARRYAAVQERLVAPDGSFPVLGRSMAYRCGAFQLLAQMALRRDLPEGVKPAQVRGALSAVLRRTLGAPGTFDADGWLRVGLAGHQPGLAEGYISTGSLYLCLTAFLPLGLPAREAFWSDPAVPWTGQRAWSGGDLPADHALKSTP